ncbi:MAG: ATP-binding protein [Gemmatimonadota bacterium]|nr:ATP-binding protein [Gemmatimonadota bacterium]
MSLPLQHRLLAESAPDPIVTIDEESTILFANAAAEKVFGYAVSELVGQSLLMLMPERLRPHHLRGIARYAATGERGIQWQGIRVPVVSKSGLEIPVEISFGEFEWEGRRLFSGFLRDISERIASDAALSAANAKLYEQAAELEQQVEEAQELGEELELTAERAEERALLETRASERARRLLDLCTSLNAALRSSEVADLILEIGMRAVGASAGSFALLSPPRSTGDAVEFEVIRTRGYTAELAAEFTRFPLQAGRPMSDSVLQAGPILIESREAAAAMYPDIVDFGYESLATIPLLAGNQAIAAIAFSFRERQLFDEATETFLRTIGEQCAQALERARLYDERNRQAERSNFLADASRLLSSSLDYEITLNLLAESAVPVLGDWCAVDIITDPALREWPPRLRRLAVVHTDPEKRAVGLELERRFPTDWNEPFGLPAVIRDGSTEFAPLISDEMLVAGTRNAEHLAMLRELQLCSVIIVPLIARGLTLGALTLVMSDSARRYTDDDVSLAQDLAGRAAVAIDNARLYREAHVARAAAEVARASAAAASKAKSNFLATMSHEIRTPINAVLGYSELLALELAGPLTEEQRAQLDRIRASTAHLLTLVNEVLDLAKIESGTLRIEIRAWVAGETADAALSLVGAQASAKGISISARCEGACESRYLGDSNRVRQVLANIMSNAVKFTKPGGSISVSCEIVDEPPIAAMLEPGIRYVAFRVADTGIGIAGDQLDAIFDAFVQAESAEGSPYTREQTGTGLGLAISRQLAHQMSGEITVESTLGAGSVFTLFVPAAPASY